VSFGQTILASVIGGVIALVGVYVASRRAATAAEEADRRREGTDHGRWIREQRLAAYTEYLTRVEAVSYQTSAVSSFEESGPGYVDANSLLTELRSQTLPAYHRVAVLGSDQVRVAFRLFDVAVDRLADLARERLNAGDAEGDAAQAAGLAAYSEAYRNLVAAMRQEFELPG
jgi:hypothetical protein